MMSGITHLLANDHRRIEDCFLQLRTLREQPDYDLQECDRLFTELRAQIIAHTKAEEMALYSLFADAEEKEEVELKEDSLEGYEEHQIFNRLLDDMESIEVTDDQWLAKLSVLTDLLEQHVRAEEKNFFPKVVKVLEPEELEDLGALYLQQQKEVYKIEAQPSASTFYGESAFQF